MPGSFTHDWRREFKRLEGAFAPATIKSYLTDVRIFVDLLQSGNDNASLTCINPAGNAVFLTGNAAVQYAVSTNGPIALNAQAYLYGSTTSASLLRELIATPGGSHDFHAAVSNVGKRALELQALVSSALAIAPKTSTVFPAAADPGSNLGAQLQMVAKLISVGKELGMRRQVFFVSAGRFDTHDNLATIHPLLMQNVANAVRAFYDTTVELGVADKVTAFTASDFGRALTANEDGTDHGWGSMHFAVGGAVKGGRYYGINPVLANNGPDDFGQGRLIPTMSVDQYGATLASWFGVSAGDLPTVFPNLKNFAGSPLGTNVGFI